MKELTKLRNTGQKRSNSENVIIKNAKQFREHPNARRIYECFCNYEHSTNVSTFAIVNAL